MGESVKEIKVGQIWVTKGRHDEPIMISKVGKRIEYRWFDNGKECFDGCNAIDFTEWFDFVADSMSDDDFKRWCMTGSEPKVDNVNHPKHYTSDPSGIECIEITRHRNFNIGNAIKYLWRAGLKDGNSDIQDLQKAIWYINDEIKRLEQQK